MPHDPLHPGIAFSITRKQAHGHQPYWRRLLAPSTAQENKEHSVVFQTSSPPIGHPRPNGPQPLRVVRSLGFEEVVGAVLFTGRCQSHSYTDRHLP
jgi:hypothetical protein